jgi:predicted metal-dependent phosphoesterase TrpH
VLVDFHSHTRESDGTLEPRALAEAMRARGVVAFSVTDHDTLAAYPSVTEGANARVVPGIEINSTYRGNEVHVLGYGMRLDDPALTAMLQRNRDARAERVATMVAQLNRAGIELSLDDVRKEAAPGAPLGRPHVAKALVRNAFAPNVESAFRGLLAREKAGYVPSIHVRPADAIATIAGAGGTPVLAHPGRLREYELIDELADAGLVGLEVFYPSHSPGQVRHFRERAAALSLVMTAGSDFHDSRYGAGTVGIEVDAADIAPFLDLVLASA